MSKYFTKVILKIPYPTGKLLEKVFIKINSDSSSAGETETPRPNSRTISPSFSSRRTQATKQSRTFGRKNYMKVMAYLASSIILVVIPVSITLVLVVISIQILCVENTCVHIPIDELFPIFSKTDTLDMGLNAANALKNTGLLLTYIVFATFFLLGLIYFRMYKVLTGLGILLIIVLSTMKTLVYWHNMLFLLDIPMDHITMGLLVWNLMITGLVIFFMLKSPLLVQQIYLIYISLLVSNFIITILTPSTAWALLGFLIIWDLVAVLTPCGPLNLMLKLVNQREKRKEYVYLPPVLIYSTMIYLVGLINQHDQPQPSKQDLLKNLPDLQRTSNRIGQDRNSDDEDDGGDEPKIRAKHRPSLGLGDFIFYSLLMGQVRQSHTMVTVLFSGLSIISGLIATLLCLAKVRRPLPALPISLTIAIICVAIFHFCTEPFAQYLNSNLIFI